MLKKICHLFQHMDLSQRSVVITVKRFLPARGTKPLPRYRWDMEDLKSKACGKYTHLPLSVRRLGGRDPNTGQFSLVFTPLTELALRMWCSHLVHVTKYFLIELLSFQGEK